MRTLEAGRPHHRPPMHSVVSAGPPGHFLPNPSVWPRNAAADHGGSNNNISLRWAQV